MRGRWHIWLVILLYCPALVAQDSLRPRLDLSAYVEFYYGFDVNRPADGKRPAYVYSHNRHDALRLNLGYVKAAYSSTRTRASLALGAGTYMQANYAAEPGFLRHLYEANLGFKLSGKRELWLDAGVLSSHIGFESAVSRDCWTLTRSMMADNSPYFETGARLGYSDAKGKWYAALLLLTGWQRIKMAAGNSLPSLGWQLQYKPSDQLTLNWSGYAGTDYPDSSRRMRYFSNLYGIYRPGENWGLIAGFDIGLEQAAGTGRGVRGGLGSWLTPVLVARVKAARNWHLAARAEYYRDRGNTIIKVNTGRGFSMFSSSLNIDYTPVKWGLLRAELKLYAPGKALYSFSLAAGI